MTTEGRFISDEQVPQRRDRRGTYVVAAIVVVSAAAMGTAAIVDGDTGWSNLLASFALMLIPPLVGVIVALVFGRRLIKRLPRTAGADPATRRRIGRALRDGSTDDPRLDTLARKEAEQQVRRRWLPWALGVVLAMQVLHAISTDRTATRWTAGLGAMAWALVLYQQWRVTQRARRYLAGPALGQATR
ncbi:hypothetical protein [Micromonospora sp. NPDC005710]|uniref:hypothetical protein n=1 Tax=Micromonospora sp. NPDC005710 TaxID=3157051 RepID=UPI0033EFCFA2